MTKNWLDPFLKASKFASQEELAEALGVSRATINRLANDHTQLKRDRAKVLAELLGTSVEALLLNRPPRSSLVSSFDPDTEEGSHEEGDRGGYTREHWRAHIDGAVPELDVKLGAGEGVVGDVINIPVGHESTSGHRVVAEWLIPSDYLRSEAKVSVNHTVVMEIVGESMQPDFLPGDRVIVDLSQTQCLHDGIYAFSDGISPPQVKRFQRIPFTNPPEVRIMSINPGYPSFQVELHRVNIIGRVCGHVTRK
jgi:SOS-response transcriptional repressor LexA